MNRFVNPPGLFLGCQGCDSTDDAAASQPMLTSRAESESVKELRHAGRSHGTF